jgi:hypothetical protein
MIGELCRYCNTDCEFWDSCENDRMKDTVRYRWITPFGLCLLAVLFIVYCVFWGGCNG